MISGKKIVKKWLGQYYGEMSKSKQKRIPLRAKENRDWKKDNGNDR
jgi:hypothetical protein